MSRVIGTLALLLGLLASSCAGLPEPVDAPSAAPGGDLSEWAQGATSEPLDIRPAPDRCAGWVNLSFDDGPTELTAAYLEVLATAGIAASWFNKGQAMEALPDAVRLQAQAGHQVENHTWSHPSLLEVDDMERQAQMERTSQIIEEILGSPPQFFRPTFGDTNAEIRAAVEEAGMFEVLWTHDTKDYLAASSDEVVARSVGMEDGDVLLLHDGMPQTLEALPAIIDHYHGEGLCFGLLEVVDDELETDLGMTHRVRAVAP